MFTVQPVQLLIRMNRWTQYIHRSTSRTSLKCYSTSRTSLEWYSTSWTSLEWSQSIQYCSNANYYIIRTIFSDPVLLCPSSCIIFYLYCLNCHHHLTDCNMICIWKINKLNQIKLKVKINLTSALNSTRNLSLTEACINFSEIVSDVGYIRGFAEGLIMHEVFISFIL